MSLTKMGIEIGISIGYGQGSGGSAGVAAGVGDCEGVGASTAEAVGAASGVGAVAAVGEAIESANDPLTIFGADLLAWWSADEGVTLDVSDNVTAVDDLSGNGNDLTNYNDVPFNATGFNTSYPAFDFVAANHAGLGTARTAVTGTGDELSVFVAGQMGDGTAAFGRLVSLGGSDETRSDASDPGTILPLCRDNTNDAFISYYNNHAPYIVVQAVSVDAPHILGVIFDGTQATLYLDEVAGTPATDEGMALTSPSQIAIGNQSNITNAWGNSGSAVADHNAAWTGPVAEIVVVKNTATAQQIEDLHIYLRAHWGLS